MICSDIPGMSQWVSNSQKDSQRPNSSPTQSRQPYRSLKRRQDDGVEASSSDSMASVDMSKYPSTFVSRCLVPSLFLERMLRIFKATKCYREGNRRCSIKQGTRNWKERR